MIYKAKIEGFDYSKLPYSDFVDTLADYVPEATLHDLGLSSDGVNHIYAYSVGDLINKPVIFTVGALHGAHEWRGAYIVREFFKKLTTPSLNPYGYETPNLTSKFSFFGIICLNPYGYENNVRGNANGVDINRNFDFKWEEFKNENGVEYPFGHVYYKGTSPFSEVESRIVRDKVLELKPISYLDLHIFGSGNFWQFACSDNTKQLEDLANSVSRSTNKSRIKNYSGGTLNNLPASSLWVETLSGSKGTNIMSLTFEPAGSDTEKEMAMVGLNGLFVYCYYVLKWYTEQKLTLLS